MEWRDGRYRFSPSDLTELLGCRHSAAQSRAAARGEREKAFAASAYANLVFAKGNEHEDDYRRRLIDEGRAVEDLRDWPRATAAARTIELMRAGARRHLPGQAGGRRLARASPTSWSASTSRPTWATGPTRRSTRSSRASRPSRRTRSNSASTARPSNASRAVRRASRTSSSAPACARRCACASSCPTSGAPASPWSRTPRPTRRPSRTPSPLRLLQLPARVRRDLADDGSPDARRGHPPDRVRAPARRRRVDATRARRPAGGRHPSRVCGRRRSTPCASRRACRSRREGRPVPPYELLPVEAGRGFARLPEPSAGDVFFDIEGHPYFTAASDLTFLFGLILADGDTWRYEPIWAHDLEQEERGARALRRPHRRAARRAPRPARLPLLRRYEPTALKRLMARHGTREEEVDELLRAGRPRRPLLRVRQGMRVGSSRYGLKKSRPCCFERAAEVSQGGESIVAYEQWMRRRRAADPRRDRRYNEEDCLSTLALRDWLLGVRPAARCRRRRVVGGARSASAKTVGTGAARRGAARGAPRRAAASRRQRALARWRSSSTTTAARSKPVWWALFDAAADGARGAVSRTPRRSATSSPVGPAAR